jgi:hypothetical protein
VVCQAAHPRDFFGERDCAAFDSTWPDASIPGFFEKAAVEGQPDHLTKSGVPEPTTVKKSQGIADYLFGARG